MRLAKIADGLRIASGTVAPPWRFPLNAEATVNLRKHRRRAVAAILLCLAACKEPPGPRYVPDAEDMERGLAAIERTGCAACHEIPGIDWPEGRLGPSLRGFDDIGLIAGAVPNTPENLAAFVRNAPAVKPGSTMPAMPLSEEESRDVAAYLYGLDDE